MQSKEEILNTLNKRSIAAAVLSLANSSAFAFNGNGAQIVSSGLIVLGVSCIAAARFSGRSSIDDGRLAAYVLANYGLMSLVCLLALAIFAGGQSTSVDGLADILRTIPLLASAVVAAVGSYLLWKTTFARRERSQAEVCPVEFRGPGIYAGAVPSKPGD